ncbi:lamin tail domain-containing protein [uncultured Flavobacterium sp.]|uniref:lamin tail domain-containing protein n=1 Tax=uncultured Flavobacterium sp. TaxID=165435 RepID=UPI0030EDF51E
MKINTSTLVHFRLLSIVVFSALFASCTTDDIAPTLIEFSASQSNLNENGGSITITAKLNGLASEQIIIPLTITGTASPSADYTVSSNQVIINKGSDTGEISINAVDDTEIEGIEIIDITLTTTGNLVVVEDYQISIQLLDDDSDTDNDGVSDSEDDCPTIPGEIANNGCPYLGFLINEVLYDPAGDLTGDANGDGVRDANDDEFIEFYNSGPALDISGYKIYDATALTNNVPRHVFPSGTIVPANGVVIVFGGGTPTGNFSGAIVQTASDGQINISNAGDIITVEDALGNVVVTLDIAPFSANPDESYTRNPDIVGDFVQHSSIAEASGALFSPGKKVNGTSF